MAWMSAIGPCITCGRIFSFNPERVPSTSVITGKREPVCKSCMDRMNKERAKKGLPPFPILPDAYESEEVP